jgi:hypothetical protein
VVVEDYPAAAALDDDDDVNSYRVVVEDEYPVVVDLDDDDDDVDSCYRVERPRNMEEALQDCRLLLLLHGDDRQISNWTVQGLQNEEHRYQQRIVDCFCDCEVLSSYCEWWWISKAEHVHSFLDNRFPHPYQIHLAHRRRQPLQEWFLL